jgi:hypothetical protein
MQVISQAWQSLASGWNSLDQSVVLFGLGFTAALLAFVVASRVLGPRRRVRQDILFAAQLAPEVARQVGPEILKFLAFGGQVRPLPANSVGPSPLIRVRLFVDYPNFLGGWRSKVEKGENPDWEQLPSRLLDEVAAQLSWDRKQLTFVGVDVYDSYVPFDFLAERGVDLPQAFKSYGYRRRQFLIDFLSLVPGYLVHIADRKPEWGSDDEGGLHPN